MATTLRLRPDAQAALDQLVADEDLSANEVISRAILERAARRTRRGELASSWAQIDDEYADLFERLRLV